MSLARCNIRREQGRCVAFSHRPWRSSRNFRIYYFVRATLLRRWPEFSRSSGISQCQRRSPSIFTSLGDISCGSTGNFSGPSPSNLFRIRANLKPQQVEPAWRTSRNSRTCVPQHVCGVGSFSQSRGIFTCRRRSPSIFASLGDISCGSAENFSGPRPTNFFTQPLALSCRTPEAALSQIFPRAEHGLANSLHAARVAREDLSLRDPQRLR